MRYPSIQDIMYMQTSVYGYPRTASVGALDDIESRMLARGYPWVEGVEKFSDPLFECKGRRLSISWSLYPFGHYSIPSSIAGDLNEAEDQAVHGHQPQNELTSGLTYLNLAKPMAASRASSMRGRVDILSKTVPASAIITQISEQSSNALFDIGKTINEKLGQKSRWPEMADYLGLPISDMVNAQKTFEYAFNKAVKGTGIDIAGLFSELKDFSSSEAGKIIGEGLTKTLSSLASSASDETTKIASNLMGTASEAASAASNIMPWIKMAVDLAILVNNISEAEWNRDCQEFSDSEIKRPMRKIAEKKLISPLHALEMWNPQCPDHTWGSPTPFSPSSSQEGVSFMLKKAYDQGMSLGISTPATESAKFWMLANLYASDPVVKATLKSMGRQPILSANDEQVAIVGVVVAVANGLDPWDFVRLLWGYCHGWWHYRDYPIDFKGGKLGIEASCTTPSGEKAIVITNAWALSFAGCATCAFALAEELKAEEKKAERIPEKKTYKMTSLGREGWSGLDSISRLAVIDNSEKSVQDHIDEMKSRGASKDAIAKLESFLTQSKQETKIEEQKVEEKVVETKKDKDNRVLLGSIGSVALWLAGAPALAVAAPAVIGFWLASRIKTT